MEYYAPNFLDEALVVLERYGARASVLAGGTLLGPRLREDATGVDALVNIKRIRSLTDIEFDEGSLRIGALATAHVLAENALVRQHAPLVAAAAATLGAPQLRSAATLGGNILSAHNSADIATALLASDAVATVHTARDGTIAIPLDRMVSPGFTGLPASALLGDVRLTSAAGWHSAFVKMQTRRAFEMALVSVAAQVREDARGSILDARIALGGAAPTPIRATAAEAVLGGGTLTAASAGDAAAAAAEVDAEPADDVLASAEYRRQLVRVLVVRALLSLRPGSEAR